jgi:hypothetical protein
MASILNLAIPKVRLSPGDSCEFRLHGAQFLWDVSTCAAGAGVFAQPRPTSDVGEPVGGKKLLLCELLHGQMGRAVLAAENYGGAFGPPPARALRTGLKDLCRARWL